MTPPHGVVFLVRCSNIDILNVFLHQPRLFTEQDMKWGLIRRAPAECLAEWRLGERQSLFWQEPSGLGVAELALIAACRGEGDRDNCGDL